MCCTFACESHQYTLRLSPLYWHNDSLASSEKPATSRTDGHIMSTIIGNNYRKLASGSQQPNCATNQFVKAKRIGVASHSARRIRTSKRILKKRRITKNRVEVLYRLLIDKH